MTLVHVVQHTSAEYLGLVEDHLEGRGIRFKYYRPFTGAAALPDRDAVRDGLVLLGGGPWGSAGARDLPTLKEEVQLARACLMREWPVVGIGLGAQILALAAGGRSEPAGLEFEVSTATADSALRRSTAICRRSTRSPSTCGTGRCRRAMRRSWQRTRAAGRRSGSSAGTPSASPAIRG